MDNMVQLIILKRQIHLVRSPLDMVYDDLIFEAVSDLAPRIADLAMEEMVDECVLLGAAFTAG
jgi:hypothetical protein